ncbi:MAG: DUF2865 domain-containing protein [Methyloceanibacter sp.]|uniref:DUF2865 domain-containing protein n=1 Tax=Methyloceanibacter sp. TaxID=1965321 RepID=UPI003D9BAAAB
MRTKTLKVAAAAAFALAAAANALAQQSTSPACQRLEAQLVSLDRGNEDPQRAETIRRAEDAANKQQFEVDRLVAQARRTGCENTGFFSIFSTPPPQCGALNNQVAHARNNLERIQSQLEQLHGGNTERAAQRRSLLIALSDNGCGAQYRQASVQQGGNFLERLFSPNNSPFFAPPDNPQSGSFRTICVRSCDGYYFPISFSAPASKFPDDERTCQRMCPASEVSLYSYRNPGEEVSQAVSVNGGAPYTSLPNAFRYRTALDAACSCRRAGQNWSEALKATGADATVAPGDVVVTEQQSRKLSQPRDAAGRPIKPDPRAAVPGAPASGEAAEAEVPPKGKVRTVGPNFYPVR